MDASQLFSWNPSQGLLWLPFCVGESQDSELWGEADISAVRVRERLLAIGSTE